MSDLKAFIGRLAEGQTLSANEARAAFDVIMSGAATPAQTGAFLMALRLRGESVDEIAGAARAMREKALTIKAPAGAIDTCGTGGDGAHTLNISTAAAIVIAAAGVPVAKHGNRAVSSKSGSADVLTELGVDLDAPLELGLRALEKCGITFLMAPRHHAAMRHVAAIRGELATRTLFNILGPLASPALVKYQIIGTFSRRWLRPMAEVLAALGTERAWIVHGADGLDELTTTGETYVAELAGGEVREFTVTPEDAGLPRARARDLKGRSVKYNARRLRELLAGQADAYRDVVLLNAGAALLVAGKVKTLKAGAARAAKAIDSGRALKTLERWAAITQDHEGGT